MSQFEARKAKVTKGPFQGFEAIIVEIKSDKIVAKVEIFGRTTQIELQIDQLDLTKDEHKFIKKEQKELANEEERLATAPPRIIKKISPAYAKEIKPLRAKLKEIYGFRFPDTFFLFWEFYQTLPEENSAYGNFMNNTLDMSLGDVFDIFDPETDLATFDPIARSRYYNDPPEFFTMLVGHTDGLHWGYYLDNPDHRLKFQVAGYYSNDAFEIWSDGYTLFEVVRDQLENFYEGNLSYLKDNTQENEPYLERNKKLDLIRDLLMQYCTAERPQTGRNYKGYRVKRKPVAPTRENMGIVLPKKLYKPLSSYDMFTDRSQGWNYCPTEKEVEEFTKEAFQLLDEGFPGAAFKLGKDLWIYSEHNSTSYQLLAKVYEVLERPTLRKMLYFRRVKESWELEPFQQALATPQETTLLNLAGNSLKSISPEIGKLTMLEHIYLSHNHLKDLPKEMASLSQLKMLQLPHNNFQQLPKVILQLKNLENLSLEKNHLTSLPDALAHMTKLRTLTLNDNPFSDFPEVLCRLSSLTNLSMMNTSIARLPESIAQLDALTLFKFSTNQRMTEPPMGLTKLKNLHTLLLSYNNTEESNDEPFVFPPVLCLCSHLKYLTIGSNQPLILPPELRNLRTLESLDIGCYNLVDFPEAILELTTLKTLSISARITKIPATIKALQNLEEINLYGNRITNVPAELAELPHLKKLNLVYNELSLEQKKLLPKLLPNVDLSL